MRSEHSHAVEDYLKAIYELAAIQERVSTTQLAERLNITPASVTGMIQRMAALDPPLVEYQKHRGVLLTQSGQTVALEIIRHHRLLELFLQRTLGYSWDEVHEEADRLEHVISEDLEERIAQALGDPSHDPHGEPIPTRDLRLPPTADTRLCDLRPGQVAIVCRVDASDLVLLRYLSEIGLVPGIQVTIIKYSPFDGNLHMQIGDQTNNVVLGPGITERIFVEESKR
ncbi:MAG: metal-dependent transcriptional regulator [Anaerolineales bacterium]|jgi:DtxR family transcriptional regulator, Mn-dependent transcriptional regulator